MPEHQTLVKDFKKIKYSFLLLFCFYLPLITSQQMCVIIIAHVQDNNYKTKIGLSISLCMNKQCAHLSSKCERPELLFGLRFFSLDDDLVQCTAWQIAVAI